MLTSIVRVMSFNIFTTHLPEDEPRQPWELWENRADLNIRTLRRFLPDLIGFQEFEPEHWAAYQGKFDEYQVHFTDANGDQHANAIFWKRERFELVEEGSFYLGSDPEKQAPDWGAEDALNAAWVKLRLKDSGAVFVFMNTQLDDESELARVNGSRLIISRLEHISEKGRLPVVFSGDFNCNPWSTAYRNFMADGFVDSYRAAGNADNVDASTFHGFEGRDYFAPEWGDQLFWRVDWILTRGGDESALSTLSCSIVRDAEPPYYPSDHYPLAAEVIFESGHVSGNRPS